MKQACDALGISRTTLYRRIKQGDIESRIDANKRGLCFIAVPDGTVNGVFCITPPKGIFHGSYNQDRDEQWHFIDLLWSLFYKTITASEPENGQHTSQKVYILRW